MYAAIDIGSNTVLLLVAECEDHTISVLFEDQQVPRLGRGVDESHLLHDDSIQRVTDLLEKYKTLLASRFPEVDSVIVTATSAVRDAQNRREFVQLVKDRTGYEVEILSGREEAAYTYQGALSVLDKNAKPYLVIDIGGGSTEISRGDGFELKEAWSMDMGCVRFTERYLSANPPGRVEISNCNKAVENLLEKLSLNAGPSTELIAVAGTATSLAYIDLGMNSYHAESINGHRIGIERLQYLISQLRKYRSEELLQKYPVVMKGRSDILLAGLLILNRFMEYAGLTGLTVSTGGIRHGALLRHSV